MATATGPRTGHRQLWIFFALTYALSWLFWVPVALSGQDPTASLWAIPFLLGGFGPSIAGIIMTYRTADRADRRDFWQRVTGFRRISAGWYLFMLLVFPVVVGLTVLLTALLGQPLPGFEGATAVGASPLSLVGMVVLGIITGPLSEELGWRGYALDQLQHRWRPLVASLLLGPAWWAWHLPLFFIKNTTHYRWGVGTAQFWLFLVAVFPLSVLMTWAYNENGRSILSAVLFHFAYNFTLGLVYPIPALAASLQIVLLSAVAAGIVALRGDRSRNPLPGR